MTQWNQKGKAVPSLAGALFRIGFAVKVDIVDYAAASLQFRAIIKQDSVVVQLAEEC